MQAVLRLLPGQTARTVENLCSDLLSDVRGEAVHRDGIGIGQAEQGVVDPVWREVRSALSSSARSSSVSSSERDQGATRVKLLPFSSVGTPGIGPRYSA